MSIFYCAHENLITWLNSKIMENIGNFGIICSFLDVSISVQPASATIFTYVPKVKHSAEMDMRSMQQFFFIANIWINNVNLLWWCNIIFSSFATKTVLWEFEEGLILYNCSYYWCHQRSRIIRWWCGRSRLFTQGSFWMQVHLKYKIKKIK